MTRAPELLAAIDAGRATTSVALLGRMDRRWRLLGSLAVPADADVDVLLRLVIGRALAIDPGLERLLASVSNDLESLPRLEARTQPARGVLVIGASLRAATLVAEAARRTPWRVTLASTETHDPREMTELALDRSVGAVCIGADDPPGPDERGALDDLAALALAIAARRADLPILVAGGMAHRRAIRDVLTAASPGGLVAVPAVRIDRGEGLRRALERDDDGRVDSRHAAIRSAATLADLLDRRVEVLDVGFDGGLRVLAEPHAEGEPTVTAVVSADGALVSPEPDDTIVDGVLAWTTGSLDRHRMTDRLRELRARPWVDQTGDGARLRLAATSAALTRLAALTEAIGERPGADLTIVAGGGLAAAPPPAIALAVADTVRRVGSTQLAWDHARLLGPLGMIEDAVERQALMADLVADAFVPLGTIVTAGGIGPAQRPERRAPGRVRLESTGGRATDQVLVPGDVAFLDLQPGDRGEAQLEIPGTVRFGRRARHVTVPVTGGLAGLLIDLRDVPLRLPERRDRRRSALARWSAHAWPRDDR